MRTKATKRPRLTWKHSKCVSGVDKMKRNQKSFIVGSWVYPIFMHYIDNVYIYIVVDFELARWL